MNTFLFHYLGLNWGLFWMLHLLNVSFFDNDTGTDTGAECRDFLQELLPVTPSDTVQDLSDKERLVG